MQECGGAPPGAGGGEEQAGGGGLAGAHLRLAGAWAEGVRPANLSRLQGLCPNNILNRLRESISLTWVLKEKSKKSTLVDPSGMLKVKSREFRYFGNGTSDHRNEKRRPLFNGRYPPKPPKLGHSKVFFSAIATFKTYDYLECLI